jgi:hypothetical protein
LVIDITVDVCVSQKLHWFVGNTQFFNGVRDAPQHVGLISARLTPRLGSFVDEPAAIRLSAYVKIITVQRRSSQSAHRVCVVFGTYRGWSGC